MRQQKTPGNSKNQKSKSQRDANHISYNNQTSPGIPAAPLRALSASQNSTQKAAGPVANPPTTIGP
jgi:hypothetical protein